MFILNAQKTILFYQIIKVIVNIILLDTFVHELLLESLMNTFFICFNSNQEHSSSFNLNIKSYKVNFANINLFNIFVHELSMELAAQRIVDENVLLLLWLRP